MLLHSHIGNRALHRRQFFRVNLLRIRALQIGAGLVQNGGNFAVDRVATVNGTAATNAADTTGNVRRGRNVVSFIPTSAFLLGNINKMRGWWNGNTYFLK